MKLDNKRILGFLLAFSTVSSCNFKEEKAEDETGAVIPTEEGVNLRFADIQTQVFNKTCSPCHVAGNAYKGVNLDTYANTLVAIQNGTLKNRTLEKKDMPSEGLDVASAALLKAWLDNGAPE